jgi:serine protease Do
MFGRVFMALRFCVFILVMVAPAWANVSMVSFADLAEKASPAVVNIAAVQAVKQQDWRTQMPQFPPGSPFEQFFKDFFENQYKNAPAKKGVALGSGFIISADGYVVTNNHVIQNAQDIKVILNDQTQLSATLVGRDEKTDLALLKVKAPKALPTLSWGDSDRARVGDPVMAIGNPFGLGGTVTAGIISARARDIQAGPYDDFIQTDAAINQGNSGGPLLNQDGQVVGINSAIFSPSGGSVGIGFSIPANMARPIVDQLRTKGKTERGWLGVRIQDITPELAESLSMDNTDGVLIARVNENSPAAKAGIEDGDVIVRYDGHDIKVSKDLPRLVASTPVGKTVTLDYVRDGARRTTTAKIERLEDAEMAEDASTTQDSQGQQSRVILYGMHLVALTDQSRQAYQIPQSVRGVLVSRVEPNSELYQAGIRQGTVILSVSRDRVTTPQQVITLVETLKKRGNRSLLMQMRLPEGSQLFVALNVAQ